MWCTETKWKEWEIKERKRHDMHGNEMKELWEEERRIKEMSFTETK
jgi:hypothetical protein